MDRKTIMGTNYARLSLKTQSLLRSVTANLPTNIQSRILESKAMFRFFDLWYKYFKKLVIATIPDHDELDESDKMSLSSWTGKNTLGAVSECTKRGIHFQVSQLIMKMEQMVTTGTPTGYPRCLNMALSGSSS